MSRNFTRLYGAASWLQAARCSAASAPAAHAVCPLIHAIVESIRDVARADATQTHAELDQLLYVAQGSATPNLSVLAARTYSLARFAQDQAKFVTKYDRSLRNLRCVSMVYRHVTEGRTRLRKASVVTKAISELAEHLEQNRAAAVYVRAIALATRCVIYALMRALNEFEIADEYATLGNELPEYAELWIYRPGVAAVDASARALAEELCHAGD